mgnify:CR=1 FL=1
MKRAIILAGGLGTRLKPFSTVIPKPLVPIDDKPILEIVINQLRKHGFKYFHGADLSQKLLDTIPKQLYQKLIKVDLNKPIDVKDNFYEATMCVGTFTFGHVKPQALDEFVRVTKKNGLICFTINEGIYNDYGFDKKIENLKQNNKWDELEFFKSDYIASKDVNAWLGLYRVK